MDVISVIRSSRFSKNKGKVNAIAIPKVSTAYTHQLDIDKRRASTNDPTRKAATTTNKSFVIEVDALFT